MASTALKEPSTAPDLDPDREARIEARLAKAREGVPDNWVELIAGSMTGDPGFEEMVRLGREWREEQNRFKDGE